MELPKHTAQIYDPDNPLFKDWERKQIGFSPFMFCEFFLGMDVLETRGVKSGEQIFGLYWGGRYCGHAYFGEKYTQTRAAEIADHIMPPKICQVMKYVKENIGIVQYKKFAQNQHAWVTERVLTKIEKQTKKEKYL